MAPIVQTDHFDKGLGASFVVVREHSVHAEFKILQRDHLFEFAFGH
jgi:hypothetical protein